MSNLTISDVRPFVGSRDFDASRDFYVALGWKLEYDSDSLRVLNLAERRFYLQNYYQKQWCENTMLHVSVECVDDWYSVICKVFEETSFSGDARISGPPQDEVYARVFHVWDPAGVLLHFAQFIG